MRTTDPFQLYIAYVEMAPNDSGAFFGTFELCQSILCTSVSIKTYIAHFLDDGISCVFAVDYTQ